MPKPGSATILSAAARYVGELESDEDIVLAGSFEGTLRTTGSVHIATTAKVQGEIHAASVVVAGRVAGPVIADEAIELQPGAVVTGDLRAQGIRIGDNAFFNGTCHMVRPEGPRRHYLIPAAVQAFGEAPNGAALEEIQHATENFLGDFGFDAEVRPERGGRGSQILRPIFRSRDALPYEKLRELLHSLESALLAATAPGPVGGVPVGSAPAGGGPTAVAPATGAPTGEARQGDVAAVPVAPTSDPAPDPSRTAPLQTTGADGARALVEALTRLRSAALLVGPVILTRFEEERGPRFSVRVRQDSLPAAGTPQKAPDPTNLLVALQNVHTEVIRDLSVSAAVRLGRRRG